jgi:hypothetical protein
MFASSSAHPGCIYAGQYPFDCVPHEARVRVAAVGFIRACLQRCRTALLHHLDSEPLSQKVRDRTVKLVVTSALSHFSVVSIAAKEALPVVSALSAETIGEAVRHPAGDAQPASVSNRQGRQP